MLIRHGRFIGSYRPMGTCSATPTSVPGRGGGERACQGAARVGPGRLSCALVLRARGVRHTVFRMCVPSFEDESPPGLPGVLGPPCARGAGRGRVRMYVS